MRHYSAKQFQSFHSFISLLRNKEWWQQRNVQIGIGIITFLIIGVIFQLNSAKGAAYTWDGGGTDGTCGGASTANNWSCANNWSSDITPGVNDTVTFNSTSTKNATITSAVSVTSITIASGYTGIITQSGSNTVTTSGAYSQADGTFTGGSGSITFAGFTLSSGTFTSTTGTLSDSGAWTHTAGGTFTHNSGTVSFTGATATIDVATTETFNALTINKNASQQANIGSGDTLIATGTVTHTDGFLHVGTVEARAAVSVAGGADGGTGTVTFPVAGDQALTGASAAKTAHMNIAKPSGTVTLSSDLQVASFTMSSGAFAGGTGTITDLDNFTLSGGTFTSTSGTLSVAGNWTHTAGGTFTHNNGTVTAAVPNASTKTWDVITTETFYNLSMAASNGSNCVMSVPSGDTLVVLNTFAQTTGLVGGTGTVEVRGAMTAGNNSGSTGIILFNQSGNQTITQGGSGGGTSILTISKPSGTVSFANANNFGISGFVLTSGTFTSTSGVLTLASGNWTHTTGGTFNHNNGTVTTNAGGTNTFDVATSETFYNLTATGTDFNRATSISTGDTLIVSNTFTHTTTSINTGTIQVNGSMTVGSTVTGSNSSTGTILFNQTGDQTITSGGGATAHLNIAKPSGTVTLSSGNVTLRSFTQSSGGFHGNTNTITLTTTFTLTGGTFTSTSGTLAIGSGAWSHTSGTFNHNNGTVQISSTASTMDLPDSATFYNFSMNKDNAAFAITLSAGNTLVVANTFTNNRGILTGGAMEIQGNIVTAIAATGTSTTPMMFLTSGDQTITGNGGAIGPMIVNKPAGTISAGSTDLQINGLNLMNGTFTSTTGTLTQRGNWEHTGGVFNPNSGTVSFASTSSSVNVPTTETFANLTFSKTSANTLTIATGDTLIATGTTAFSAGLMSGGTVEAQGNVTVAAAFNVGGTTGSTLVFAGNANQTLTATGGETNFDGDITINKGGGKVTLSSGLTLNATNQDFTVFNGTFDLGTASIFTVSGTSGTVTVGTNGVLQGVGTGGSFILGVTLTNNGTVNLNSNGVACGDADSIQIRSTVGGSQRAWNGTGKFLLTDIDVRDMGGSATIVAQSSTVSSGMGANWTVNSTCGHAVSTPNGSESWPVRSSQNITWSTYTGADHYRLFYSTNSGGSWTEIGTTASTTYAWTVPGINTTTARILIAAENSGNTVLAQDMSDADFTILTFGTILKGGIEFKGGVTF